MIAWLFRTDWCLIIESCLPRLWVSFLAIFLAAWLSVVLVILFVVGSNWRNNLMLRNIFVLAIIIYAIPCVTLLSFTRLLILSLYLNMPVFNSLYWSGNCNRNYLISFLLLDNFQICRKSSFSSRITIVCLLGRNRFSFHFFCSKSLLALQLLNKLLKFQPLLLTLVVVEQVCRYLSISGVEEVVDFVLLVMIRVLRTDRMSLDVSALVLMHRLCEDFENAINSITHSLIWANLVKEESDILKGL